MYPIIKLALCQANSQKKRYAKTEPFSTLSKPLRIKSPVWGDGGCLSSGKFAVLKKYFKKRIEKGS